MRPSHPVSTVLADGIVVVERIPVDELAAEAPPRIDPDDVCGSVPAGARAELGFGEPNDEWSTFCQWTDADHPFVNIGYDEASLPAQVRTHVADASRRSGEPLRHLLWLRIDGRYAVERILAVDPLQSCTVIADYGSEQTLLVTVYSHRQTPAEAAIGRLCPVSRRAAQAVLRHLRG